MNLLIYRSFIQSFGQTKKYLYLVIIALPNSATNTCEVGWTRTFVRLYPFLGQTIKKKN